MKFNYKKIGSVLASAVMLSSTIGFAAALSYPAPFVSSGAADGAVVVGSAGEASDWAAAVGMATELSGLVSTDSTTSSVAGGKAKTLASGSDLVYLNDDLAENVASISESDLPTVLADGTFTDDDGTDYEYKQLIDIGTSTNNGLAFSDSDADLDDPTILIKLTDTETTAPVYTLIVDFGAAVPFNATASEGESIKLFGKEYTVGTSTDGDTLVLLGGASETTINVGESITAEIAGVSHEVSLIAISTSDTAPQASISVDGQTNTFTEGQTKKVNGIDVFAKTVFKTGDNQGYVIMQLGSDRLTFEDLSAVKTGTDADDIEGTNVDLTGAVNNLTKISINISAPDNNENHILKGESFVDPVFGSVSLDFVDLKNAPMLEVQKDVSTTRKMLGITDEGSRELGLDVDVKGNDNVKLPFGYQGILADDNNDVIHVVEGENLVQDDYFILNSGNYQYFMELKKVSLGTGSNANSDVHFKDLLTGTTYNNDNEAVDDDDVLNSTAGTTATFNINSQVFTVTSVNASAVTIVSSDYGKGNSTNDDHIDVFPIIETIDGKDHRFALIEDVTINNLTTGNILNLPGGTVTVLTNTTFTNATGEIGYQITPTALNDSGVSITIGIARNLAIAGQLDTNASVLFLEEEDKSEATTTTKNAVWLGTDDDGTIMQALTPVTTATDDNATFDDTQYTGYLTNFGTYVLRYNPTGTNDPTTTSLTYSADQMYAEVFVSETGTTITPGSSGAGGQILTVRDSDVSSVAGKNLLVVGGSCVNTVAAKILGSTSPLCGPDFTEVTQVSSGQYILKTVESPYNTDKVAMLVAGYNAADTVNAVARVREGASTDVGEAVYPQLA